VHVLAAPLQRYFPVLSISSKSIILLSVI
jgi:hypothetical protein